jgi:hypothetical protein
MGSFCIGRKEGFRGTYTLVLPRVFCKLRVNATGVWLLSTILFNRMGKSTPLYFSPQNSIKSRIPAKRELGQFRRVL